MTNFYDCFRMNLFKKFSEALIDSYNFLLMILKLMLYWISISVFHSYDYSKYVMWI